MLVDSHGSLLDAVPFVKESVVNLCDPDIAAWCTVACQHQP